MSVIFKYGQKMFQVAAALFLLPLMSSVSMASSDGQATDSSSRGLPYQVVCEGEKPVCKVDKGTYKGWRTYHSTCHVCHAQDAVGSTFAPSLIDRLKGMDKEKFMDVVLNGFTGEVGVMPGWKDDPNVLPRIDDLWGYLKARSDGALGTGKPKKIR